MTFGEELEICTTALRKDDVVVGREVFVLAGKTNEGRVSFTSGDDSIEEEVQGAFAVGVEVSAVAAVVEDLPIALTLSFHKHISVDVGVEIIRSTGDFFVVTIDEIELSIAVFDPIVSNDSACGAVFQVVAQAPLTKGTVVVVFEGDPQAFGVAIVLVDAVHVAVAKNMVPSNEEFRAPGAREESIARG